MGPQTLTAPFTISATNFPTRLRTGVPCFKKILAKVNVPAQLFLIMVAICSTKGFLGVPETPLNSESH